MQVICVVAVLAGALGSFAPEERRAVVVVTDIGNEVDDQWTIAHLALSPEFEVRGIVTTHATNLAAPAAETSANYARELVGKFPPRIARPAVVVGSNAAMAEPVKVLASPGVDFLIEQAKGRTSDHRLIVVAIGAATDIASAVLADPTFSDRVQVVAMGFARYPQGGDPWNVKNDPLAWRVLLDSRTPIVVGDAEITRRMLRMTPDRAHTLLAQLPEPAPMLLNRFDSWLAQNAKFAQSDTGSPIVWPIWDEVTTAYLLGMARVESRPRPRLREDLSFDLAHPNGTIDWVVGIDEARIWTDLTAKIRSAN